MNDRNFFVYIMANQSRTIYTGVTNDIFRRVQQHKDKTHPGFTSKYNINKLVYYEECPDAYTAIEREKQIKGWIRNKKIVLIESENPNWHDLSLEWYSS
jgi:putative endonuclease